MSGIERPEEIDRQEPTPVRPQGLWKRFLQAMSIGGNLGIFNGPSIGELPPYAPPTPEQREIHDFVDRGRKLPF